MSTMTQCVSYSGRLTPMLPPSRMLRIVFALSIAGLFMVAHLRLRFGVNELRAETIRLQISHEKVLSQNNSIAAQNESLMDPQRLRDFARNELGMAPASRMDKESLVIPPDVAEKYTLARAARQQAPISPEDRLLRERAVWLAAFGERMGLSSNAQARETVRRRH